MMKKNYLWMAAMASLLSFTACSDDASPIENPENPGEVVMDDGTTIELAVSNTGIGTRAARPMGSSAAANNVNKVQLKFYVSDNGTSGWTEVTNITTTGVEGGDKGILFNDNIISFTGTVNEKPHTQPEDFKKIKLGNLVANKYYRIVGYGYNETFPYGIPTPVEGTLGLFKTGDNHGKDKYTLEEVFAGYVEAKTNAKAKFTPAPRVELTRQVAGILAYFKIPYKIGEDVVTKVAVVACDKSKGFKFPNFLLGADKTANAFNGIATSSTQQTVDELITFTMRNLSTDEDQEYYISTNNSGLADDYIKPANLAILDDSFFGARYILPFEKTVDKTTLQVILYGDDKTQEGTSGKDQKVLKTLSVTTNQTGFNDPKKYDIRCNNFYSIGKKLYTDNTGGDPDPKPEPENPDPDKPIDLGATDQIIVEINDAWEILHDMGVEEE